MSKQSWWLLKLCGLLFLTGSCVLYAMGCIPFVLFWFTYVIGVFGYDFGCFLQYTE